MKNGIIAAIAGLGFAATAITAVASPSRDVGLPSSVAQATPIPAASATPLPAVTPIPLPTPVPTPR